MPDWSAGYVADIGYTYGTYAELNPHRMRLALLMAGIVPPEIGTACELGFGQGMSVNMHAAGSDTTWYGTDFNPSQAAFAQELVSASGANAHLYDQSFAEFCTRTDLPDFDFIGLHGIFSWISDENRAIIVDFIRRKLKVGGVLYISYNTQPGWAAMAPVRDLMTEYASVMGAPGQGSLGRVEQSLGFMDRLFAAEPRYLTANPTAKPRFERLKAQNRSYVAHEYFNRDWVPLTFAQMARWLEPAKVGFACSAHYLDQIEAINLSADQQKVLAEVTDVHLAQTVRDFIINQTFRRDYWVRGPRKLGVVLQDKLLRELRVALTTPRADVTMKATGPVGEISLNAGVYEPLLDFLADHQPRTIDELITHGATHQLTKNQVLQAIYILTGIGSLAILRSEEVAAQARPRTDRLNAHLSALSLTTPELQQLVSPATGGAVPVDSVQMLFVLARSQGEKDAEQWARFANAVLARQGRRLIVDGKPTETDEEQSREMIKRATTFREQTLPILQTLGVIG